MGLVGLLGDTLANGYVSAVSRFGLRRLSRKVLAAALRAEGYDNYQSHHATGELYFLNDVLCPEKPQVIFDVGANVGHYTRELVGATGAHIYAFEPLPGPFSDLERLASEHPGRVTALNTGVSNETTVMRINYNPQRTTHASFSSEIESVAYVEQTETLDVPTTTLDDFVAERSLERLDFLKIDTEGFEHEVLTGARGTLATLRPKFIQIEYNWHQLFRGQSLYALSQLLPGYDVYQLVPGSWVKRDPKEAVSNYFAFSNFIFVRGD